jgi:hypothetical protein
MDYLKEVYEIMKILLEIFKSENIDNTNQVKNIIDTPF